MNETLNIFLEAEARGEDAIARMSASLRGLGGITEGVGGIFSRVAGQAAGFVTGMIAFNVIGKAFDAVKESMFGFNDMMQRAQISFTNFLHDGNAASSMLTDIGTLARTTPFDMPQLVTGAQRLLAMGFAGRDVIPTLHSVADAVAAAGGTSENIEHVTRALGEMLSAGRVNARDMMQLTSAGIDSWKILAQGLNVTTGEARALSEKGLIPADKALKILIDGMEKGAPDAAIKMGATWSTAASNLKDIFTQLTATAMKPFFDVATQGAKNLGDFLATDKVRAFTSNVADGMQIAANAAKALFTGDLSKAGDIFARIGQAAQSGLILIANAVLEVVPTVASTLINLATNAASWGFNVIGEFASGMVEAANSLLQSVMTGIANAIAAFIASFSPPKKGPLKDINIWGMNLIGEYLSGMQHADFGVLNDITSSIKDVLTRQLQLGNIGEVDFIPKLIGSQTIIAEAIAGWRQFGTVSSDVLSKLGEFLGEDTADISQLLEGLIKVADAESKMQKLDDRIKEIDKSIREQNHSLRDVDDQYKIIIQTLERTISQNERLYDKALSNLDKELSALDRNIAARERMYKLGTRELDLSGMQLKLEKDTQLLAEARVEHIKRAEEAQARLNKVNDEAANIQRTSTRELRDANASATQSLLTEKDPKKRATIQTNLVEHVSDINLRTSERLHELATERAKLEKTIAENQKPTVDDKIKINGLEHDLLEDANKIKILSDQQLQTWKDQAVAIKEQKDDLTFEKDDVIKPMKEQLDAIKQAHEDLRQPIVDRIELLNREKDAINDQKADLQLEIDDQKKLNDTISGKLAAERMMSDEYKQQLDLLNKLAEAAAAAEKKGKKGGGGAGAGAGMGALGAGGLGLKAIEMPKIDPIKIDDLKKQQRESIDKAVDDFKAHYKEKLETAINDTFEKIHINGALLGGAIGVALGLWFGGPGGAILGGIIGAGLGEAVDKAIPNLKKRLLGQDFRYEVPTGHFDEQTATPDTTVIKSHEVGDLEPQVAKLKDVLNALKPVVKEVVDFVKQEFDVIKKWWDTNGEDVTRAVERWGMAFVNVGAIILKLLSVLHVFDAIDQGLKTVLEGIRLWAAFTNADWGKLFGDLGKMVGEFFSDLGKRFQEIDFGAWIKEGFEKLRTITVPIGEDLLHGLWEGIKTGASWLLDQITGFFDDFINSFKNYFMIGSPSKKMADEVGKPLIEGLWDGAKEVFDSVISWIGEIAGKIFDAIGDVTGTLTSHGQDLLTGLWEGAKDVWDKVSSWIANRGPEAFAAILDLGQTLLSRGQDLLTGLWDGAKNVWDTVSTWLSQRGSESVTAVADVIGHLKQKGMDLLQGFLNGVMDFWDAANGVAQWLRGIGQRAFDAIPNALGALKSVGADLVQGLMNGIQSMVEPALKVVRGLFNAVIHVADEFHGSPWPATVQDGSDYVQGFIDGVGKRKNDVEKAIYETFTGSIQYLDTTLLNTEHEGITIFNNGMDRLAGKLSSIEANEFDSFNRTMGYLRDGLFAVGDAAATVGGIIGDSISNAVNQASESVTAFLARTKAELEDLQRRTAESALNPHIDNSNHDPAYNQASEEGYDTAFQRAVARLLLGEGGARDQTLAQVQASIQAMGGNSGGRSFRLPYTQPVSTGTNVTNTANVTNNVTVQVQGNVVADDQYTQQLTNTIVDQINIQMKSSLKR